MPRGEPPGCPSAASMGDDLEEVLERFERDWRPGSPPCLEEYLPAGPGQRRRVLIELVHSDLECRLKAGMSVRVESYLERHPELAGDRAIVLGLIKAEHEFRRRREPGLTPQEFFQRFPLYTEELRSTLPGPSASDEPRPRAGAAPAERRSTAALPEKAAVDEPSTVPGNQVVYRGAPGLTAEPAQPWPLLPGYEILEELGRGNMGVVYKARQVGLNRLVALKVILHEQYAGPEMRHRFQAEAEAVARLSHPNIVQVYEVGEHQGRPFLSLEFCPERSLDRKLAGTPLPAQQAARLTQTLAGAVQAAHQAQVIHRDLKPANVVLGANGIPKVTDFGLAKLQDEVGHTASGMVIGSPSYMAPEQAHGRTREVGPAADIYALGAILYECLTGRPPFKAATVFDTLQQVVEDDPVPPRHLQARVPPDLETICLKCLKKEPRKRYDSAAELADDLRRWLDGEPIQARPVGKAERLWRWSRRNRLTASLLATLVAVFLGGFAGVTWQWLRAEVYWANVVAREGLERQRLTAKRAECQLLFETGKKAWEAQNWQHAKDVFLQARGKIGSEPELADLQARAEDWLEKTDDQLKRKEREQQDAARRLQAVSAVDKFRRLADEMAFHAAASDSVGERIPFYDPRKAESAGRAAVALAGQWGRTLEQLPLPHERDGLKRQLREVLLLLVQLKTQQCREPGALEELFAHLDWTEALGGPSQSCMRLRSTCHRLAGDPKKAAAEAQRADALGGSGSALDHFLLGEHYRSEARSSIGVQPEGALWKPTPALLSRAIEQYRLARVLEPTHYWSTLKIIRLKE